MSWIQLARTGQGPAAAKLLGPNLSQAQLACESWQLDPAHAHVDSRWGLLAPAGTQPGPKVPGWPPDLRSGGADPSVIPCQEARNDGRVCPRAGGGADLSVISDHRG
eukprot:NODE_3710_length_892_cov_10.007117_g3087_i0.p1 GENE.NODE_3710_length_892_cov_10.007117_g3087_i0~~NODE_3710_length_892_cov_10.007117_g3087_i0.p1  ORF type:complete len:107 (-),score=3.91 NODE_3710_length_892_cov_10.007117_g3087_i0:142-462(-)